MKKIRCYLAVIALIATLSGFSLQGMGSVANAASSQHASASFVVGKSAGAVARYKPNWPCPVLGSIDC